MFLLSCFYSCLFSQQAFKGKIIDSENGTPLDHVKIKNIQTKSITFSNKLGEFEIRGAGIYQFFKSLDIKTIQNTSFQTEFVIIQLELNPSQLNEVIVNANHIPQKLKKSNTTIDIISI